MNKGPIQSHLDVSGDVPCRSVSELAQLVSQIVARWKIEAGKSVWFRGHSVADWTLLPSLFRSPVAQREREILRDFQLQTVHLNARPPVNQLEWFADMQHYGVPTRLLDWTESYLVALYFACSANTASDGAIWAMRPAYLNDYSLSVHTIPVAGDPRLNGHLLLDLSDSGARLPAATLPASFRPVRSQTRIIAQRGTFTIHGRDQLPLESIFEQMWQSDSKVQAIKIVVPSADKRDIVAQLRLAGITHASIFPELEGVAREIVERYTF